MFRFFADFFSNPMYCVRLCTITSPVRRLDRGVPQGSCLSSVLFNIVLSTLLLYISCQPSPSCGIIIYAYDICLWASHETRRILCPFVQASIARVLSKLPDLGFTVFLSKTAVLICSSRPLRKGFPKLYLYDNLLLHVRTNRYLGATIDSRLTWCHHVVDLSPHCDRMTSIARKIHGIYGGDHRRQLFSACIDWP